jgi:alpha-tubulin suppressor-like RCC1 family protein
MPAAVLGISDAARLALGSAHSCVRRAGGELRCWGSNRYGQLGDGTTTGPATSAIDVTVIGTASEIVASEDHTCAATATDVRCWGSGHGMTSPTVVTPSR